MRWWLVVYSDDYGQDLYGEYESRDEAIEGAKRILVEAINLDDGVCRSFGVLQARTRRSAERKAAAL